MRRMNLTNTDLRRVIEWHSKFFDAESRTKRLSNYVTVNEYFKNPDSLIDYFANFKEIMKPNR